jgi:hypothetical protein
VDVKGGILAGNGVINGSVTDYPGVGVYPTDFTGSSYGSTTLTINNAFTMQGTVTMCIKKTGGTRTNDMIAGITTANYGGTLVITNVTSDTNVLAAGDTFTLFSAGTHNGNFTNIVGSPGTGLVYSFTNGVLSVAATMISNPTNITFSVSGSTLSLSWPEDHQGWMVQSNSVNLAVPADWYDISNTASGTNYSITIDASKPNVFYRLRKP